MKKRLLSYTLAFFSGIFLVLSIVYYSEWRYEEDILNILAKQVSASCANKGLANIVDSAMSITHKIVEPMASIYGNEDFNPGKSLFTSPSFLIYYFGKGACGGYSSFTSRLLSAMNIRTRFVQQNVRGVQGGHITLVVENGTQLLLIDPMFAWSFRDTLGRMSDIHDVAANWGYYQRHKPKHYRNGYNYQQGWTYTNWDKLGILSRGIYKVGTFLLGKQRMDNISIRIYLLGTSKIYFYIFLSLFICCTALLLKGLLHTKSLTLPVQ